MNLMDIINRYDRQQMIDRWDQDKLASARIAVVGSDYLAQFVCTGLAALGTNIDIVDNQRFAPEDDKGLLGLSAKSGVTKAQALSELASKINPHIRVRAHHLALLYEACFEALPRPDLIIEASNNSNSKHTCLSYARRKAIPVILGASSEYEGKMWVYNSANLSSTQTYDEMEPSFLDYETKHQGSVPSQVIAGLILEEARKMIMPLDEYDTPANRPLQYNLASPNRFDDVKEFAALLGSSNAVDGFHHLLVGAGALGTQVAIGLILKGAKKLTLTIYDPDIVDQTNLNRQILFYDCIGEYKAPALVENLQKINPGVEYEAVVGEVDEACFKQDRIDLIFSCVDNFQARAFLNYMARKYKIPLVNGGTGPKAGQVMVYKPGETACLNCCMHVDKLAEQEKARASCVRAPEPSVIITNQIIGGLMVGEAGSLLNPEEYGPPLQGIIEFNSIIPERIGIRPSKERCNCHKAS